MFNNPFTFRGGGGRQRVHPGAPGPTLGGAGSGWGDGGPSPLPNLFPGFDAGGGVALNAELMEKAETLWETMHGRSGEDAMNGRHHQQHHGHRLDARAGNGGASWHAGAGDSHPRQGAPPPQQQQHRGGGGAGGDFQTFNPPTAHWSLNDYAWDWCSNRVVSRSSIAAASRRVRDEAWEKQLADDEARMTARASTTQQQQQHQQHQEQGGGGKGLMGGAGVSGNGFLGNGSAPRGGRGHSAWESFESSDGNEFGEDKLKAVPGRVHVENSFSGGTRWMEGGSRATARNFPPPLNRQFSANNDKGGGGVRKSETAPQVRVCPVQSCNEHCRTSSKKRIERILCAHHAAQPQVCVGGETKRFCQVCYILHCSDAFRGKNKTCNAVLERKKLLRYRGVQTGAATGADSGGSGDPTQATMAGKRRAPDSDSVSEGTTTTRGGTSDNTTWEEEENEQATETLERQSIWSTIMSTVGAGVLTKQAVPKKARTEGYSGGGGGSEGPGAGGGGHRGYGHWGSGGATAYDRPDAFSSFDVLSDSDRQLLRDMEEGSLTSMVVPSAAIKVPYAVPEDLLTSGGVGTPVLAGGMAELMRWMDVGVPSESGAVQAQTQAQPGGRVQATAGWAGEHDAEGRELTDTVSMRRSSLGEWPGSDRDFNVVDALSGRDASMHMPGHIGGVFDEAGSPLGGFAPGFFNIGGGSAGLIPAEDLGFDIFIRPGSLIFGVHAQGAVVSPTATEQRGKMDDGPKVSDTIPRSLYGHRHTAGSLLESCANGNSLESKLVRCATSALNVGFGSNSSYWSSRGAHGSAHGSAHRSAHSAHEGQARPDFYDATGAGLLTIPEGVFGSFNGEISRLELGPDGVPMTVAVRGLPEGFPAGLLDAAASVLDSGQRTATVRLPWTPRAGTTIVCMYQGAHLPLRVQSVQEGATELEISFAPEGGYDVPAKWAVSGGVQLNEILDGEADNDGEDGGDWEDGDDGEDVDGDGAEDENGDAGGTHEQKAETLPAAARRHAHARERVLRWKKEFAKPITLEGTATLEVLIADGPMRGLPVGVAVPLLLTPDSEMRHELVAAMARLQQAVYNNSKKARGGRRKPLPRVSEEDEEDNAAGDDGSDGSGDREGTGTDRDDNENGDDNESGDNQEAVMPPPVALLSMLGAVLAAHGRGQEANPRMWRGALAMTRYFQLRRTAERLGVRLVARHSRSAAATASAMRAFDAITGALVALWRVRVIGIVAVLICLAFTLAYPVVNWEDAVSFGTAIAALQAVVPFVIFRAARPGARRRGPAHAEHAVMVQNCGAFIGPFVSLAVILVHLNRYRAGATAAVMADGERALGEHETSGAYLLTMMTAETFPAIAVLLFFRFYLAAKSRARHWPRVSIGVHVMRMGACLIRSHYNYYLRRQLYSRLLINVCSAVLASTMFPLWDDSQAVAVHTGLVVSDWVGHYAHTGTAPAHLVPSLRRPDGQTNPVTAAEVWRSAVEDFVWRGLLPAAVNAYIMHRVVTRRGRTGQLSRDE